MGNCCGGDSSYSSGSSQTLIFKQPVSGQTPLTTQSEAGTINYLPFAQVSIVSYQALLIKAASFEKGEKYVLLKSLRETLSNVKEFAGHFDPGTPLSSLLSDPYFHVNANPEIFSYSRLLCLGILLCHGQG